MCIGVKKYKVFNVTLDGYLADGNLVVREFDSVGDAVKVICEEFAENVYMVHEFINDKFSRIVLK